MRTPWRLFALLVAALTLVTLHAAGAQPTGQVVVTSDQLTIGFGEISASGRITWTLTGDAAVALREKVLRMYDERPSVPRGFPFYTQPTAAQPNGVIDSPEALKFLEHLDLLLEASSRVPYGTPFRFGVITRADRAEQDLPAERSTNGLVGADANTTEALEIRFIFNGESRAPVRTFRQAGEAVVHALHDLFTFDAVQDFAPAGCLPECYPFPARGGWHVVSSPANAPWPPGAFLWHGNRSAAPWVTASGVYEPAAANVTAYSPAGVPGRLDLRFATTANLTFEHTGWGAPGDDLFVQVSRDGTTWTSVRATNDGDTSPAVDGIDLAQLRTSIFDLSPWLGSQVYVRLRFAGNGDATVDGPGYFVRNLRIFGPSRFVGDIDFRHIDYVLGSLSFSDFASPTANPHLIRTPIGEFLFYSAAWTAGDPPLDEARYATFAFPENPQVLFVLFVAAVLGLRHVQERSYRRFLARHSLELRDRATRTKWIHWSGRVGGVVLALLYFFPTAFGISLFVYGVAYWVVAIGMAAGLGGFTALWYARRARHIPREPTIGIGERLAGDLPPPAPEDPRGHRYLFAEDDPTPAFERFKIAVDFGAPGLCFATGPTEDVRRDHRLPEVEMYSVSDTNSDRQTLDAKRLDFEVLRVMSAFLREHDGCAVIVEGLELLVLESPFDRVLEFVKRANDLARVHGATLFLALSPAVLGPGELALLEKEFDRVETMGLE